MLLRIEKYIIKYEYNFSHRKFSSFGRLCSYLNAEMLSRFSSILRIHKNAEHESVRCVFFKKKTNFFWRPAMSPIRSYLVLFLYSRKIGNYRRWGHNFGDDGTDWYGCTAPFGAHVTSTSRQKNLSILPAVCEPPCVLYFLRDNVSRHLSSVYESMYSDNLSPYKQAVQPKQCPPPPPIPNFRRTGENISSTLQNLAQFAPPPPLPLHVWV